MHEDDIFKVNVPVKDNRPIEERIMVILDDNSTSNLKEIIWVDAGWKEIIEKMTSAKVVEKEVVRSVVEFKKNIDVDLEYADYLVDNFKKKMEAYRAEVKQMYESEYDMLEETYKELGKQRKGIYDKVEEIKKELAEGVEWKLKAIQEQLTKLNLYNLDRLIDVFDKFSKMSDSDKSLFAAIIGGYKQDN